MIATSMKKGLPFNPVVKNLVSGGVTDTQIILNWDAIVGVTYNVYMNGVLQGNVGTNTYTKTGLAAVTAYTFQVAAVRGLSEFAKTSAIISTSVVTDPYWANVVLLMKGNNFVESKLGCSVTVTGNVTTNGTDLVFGTSGNNYLTIQDPGGYHNLGLGDFTVECFSNSTLDGIQRLFTFGGITGTTNGGEVDFTYLTGGKLEVITNGAGTTLYSTAAGGAPINNNNHMALTRQGGVYRVLINGSMVYQGVVTSQTLTPKDSATLLGIKQGNGYPFRGKVNNFRVTNGVSRYNGNYAIPAVPFPTA